MPRFQDITAFMTGHPGIDAEHVEMATIIDAIAEELQGQAQPENCHRLLASFLEVAVRHFENEERVLEDYGFPQLERHRLYHRELLDRAREVKDHCDAVIARSDLRSCFEEMAKFFIDDVIRGDSEFISHLQAVGAARH